MRFLYRCCLQFLSVMIASGYGASGFAAPETEVQEYDDTISEFQLGIKILGTIASQKNRNSVALLKFTKDNKVLPVLLKAPIGTDYQLVAIKSDYLIVMNVQNKKRSLVVKGGHIPLGMTATPSVASVASKKNKAFEDTYKEDGFERNGTKITMTQAYQRQLVDKDLAGVLMQASAEPVMGPNGIEGFNIDLIEPGSIYEKAGLANGDVVTSINGIGLTDVTATIKLLRSLKSSTSISIDVKRDGVLHSLSMASQ